MWIAGLLVLISATAIGLVWARRLRDRPKSLDKLQLDGKLNFMISAGSSGTCLSLTHCDSGDVLELRTVRSTPGGDSWIELQVATQTDRSEVRPAIETAFSIIENRIKLDPIDENGGIRFVVRGPHARDYNSLAGVVVLVARTLGHAPDALYVVRYEGDYDEQAVRRFIDRYTN